MGKKLSCKDAGIQCDHVIHGASEDEVMQKAAQHAAKEHGMTDVSPEVQKKLRTLIQDE
jgi:predicted small metal-binding protein